MRGVSPSGERGVYACEIRSSAVWAGLHWKSAVSVVSKVVVRALVRRTILLARPANITALSRSIEDESRRFPRAQLAAEYRGRRTRQTAGPRSPDKNRRQRRMPQRPALRRRVLPLSRARRARTRGRRHHRGSRQTGDLREARRSRDLLPVGVLWKLRSVYVGASESMLEQGRHPAQSPGQAAHLAEGQAGQPVPRHFVLLREDAAA